ncbi:hypothetical protein KC968_04235 [Candidatus Saccharibacteria bacterium]|nr:hypothetical protein [Candidatus Saccharibacteria bacterium]
MKHITNLKFVALFAFLVAIPFVAGAYSERAYAEEKTTQKQEQKADTKEEAKEEPTFAYIAQPGDSYSLMARKAIQSYGIVNKVNLSQAQIIFAETMLTQEAGSPSILVGQKVVIKQSTVKNWIEKAQKLSDKEKAAWNVYAQGANFNTDNVGEPRS